MAILVAGSVSGAVGHQAQGVETLFREGQRYEDEGLLEEALQRYSRIATAYADTDLADDALLASARVHWWLGQPEECRAQLDRLIQDPRYRFSPNVVGAYVLLAEMEWSRATDPSALDRARDQLALTVEFGPESYPGLLLRSEARVLTGELSLLLGDDETAARAFGSVIGNEPLSEWTAAARLGLADILMRQGRWEDAAAILQPAIDDGDADNERWLAAKNAARRRLGLIHRLRIRPLQGLRPYIETTVLPVSRELRDPRGLAATEDGRLYIVDTDAKVAFAFGGDAPGVSLEWSAQIVQDFGRPWWEANGLMPQWVRPTGFTGYIPYARGAYFKTFSRGELRPQGYRDSGNDEGLKELQVGARDMYGRWFLIDDERQQVARFSRDGIRYAALLRSSHFRRPADLTTDRFGQLYVLDRDSKSLIRFAADLSSSTALISDEDRWGRPEAVAVDPLLNVYVLDRDKRQVFVYDAAGKLIQHFGPQLPGSGQRLAGPRDLAVDGSGTIYVGDVDRGEVFVVR